MKIYNRDELYWPDANEIDRAMREARRMRSECLVDMITRGVGAIGRALRALGDRYRHLQCSVAHRTELSTCKRRLPGSAR